MQGLHGWIGQHRWRTQTIKVCIESQPRAVADQAAVGWYLQVSFKSSLDPAGGIAIALFGRKDHMMAPLRTRLTRCSLAMEGLHTSIRDPHLSAAEIIYMGNFMIRVKEVARCLLDSLSPLLPER
jgi:hypothetical protein